MESVMRVNDKTRVPPTKLPFALRRATPGMSACVLRTKDAMKNSGKSISGDILLLASILCWQSCCCFHSCCCWHSCCWWAVMLMLASLLLLLLLSLWCWIFCCGLWLSKFEHAVAGGPAVTAVNAGVLAIASLLWPNPPSHVGGRVMSDHWWWCQDLLDTDISCSADSHFLSIQLTEITTIATILKK